MLNYKKKLSPTLKDGVFMSHLFNEITLLWHVRKIIIADQKINAQSAVEVTGSG